MTARKTKIAPAIMAQFEGMKLRARLRALAADFQRISGGGMDGASTAACLLLDMAEHLEKREDEVASKLLHRAIYSMNQLYIEEAHKESAVNGAIEKAMMASRREMIRRSS